MCRMWHKVIFWSEYSWFKFSVYLLLNCLPYYLLIAGERREEFVSFPSKTQAALLRIGILVPVSLSCDNDCHTEYNFLWPLHHAHFQIALSDRVVEYINCTSTEGKTSPLITTNECPDMTLNHLIVRLQLWSFGKYGAPSLLLLPGPLWPRVVVLVRITSTDQAELFNHLLYLKSFNCVQTI